MMHLPTRYWKFVSLAEAAKLKPPRATIDFETRSAFPIKNGAWLYSKHPTTRVISLAFCLPGQDPEHPSLWMPALDGFEEVRDFPLDEDGYPYDLDRLFEHIRNGGLVEAHNVNFESCIWLNVMQKPEAYDRTGCKGMDAPPVMDSQWYCSAAKAAALALPRDLEGAGIAMDMPEHLRKLAGEGKRLLDRYSKPRKARKQEPKFDEFGDPIVYWHPFTEEDLALMGAYNKQDVVAEHALSDRIPDLDSRERQVWLADFRANRRGVLIDRALVDMCIHLEGVIKEQMNAVLKGITTCEEYPEGIKGTERAKLMDWLALNGLSLPDTRAATLDHWMSPAMAGEFGAFPESVQTVVRFARNINRASVSKFKRILACMDPDDGRVRELVMYHGAATGRWSGKGIQVQNFPKGNIAELLGVPGDSPLASMERVVADVMTGDVEWLRIIYKDPLSVLSSVLRGALIPSPGKTFYVADYSAIEARVVLWLAGAIDALDVFRRGEDIYCDMASGIYRRPINRKQHPKERGFGKIAILGLGYGMGWLTFLLTLRSFKIKFKREEALEVLGDTADKYISWIKAQMWPERPDELDYKDEEEFLEAYRKFKTKRKLAQANLRRLMDEREDPESIIEEMALCKYVVDTYRKRYPEVKELWKAQEQAATKAVALWKRYRMDHDGEAPPEPLFVDCGHVTWYVEDRWLFCVLPSGRKLAYNSPDVKIVSTPWGDKSLSLRFMGVHKKTKKWARMSSYGGSIVENIDQATARDMMADALIRIDDTSLDNYGFDLLASIHDESVSEGPLDGYEAEHMEDYRGLMKQLAPCYEGCPVDAEGAPLMRYSK